MEGMAVDGSSKVTTLVTKNHTRVSAKGIM